MTLRVTAWFCYKITGRGMWLLKNIEEDDMMQRQNYNVWGVLWTCEEHYSNWTGTKCQSKVCSQSSSLHIATYRLGS